MASTIEIENTQTDIEKLALIEYDSDTPCADAWTSDVQFFIDYLGVSERKAERLADLAFKKCLKEVYVS